MRDLFMFLSGACVATFVIWFWARFFEVIDEDFE